MKKTLLALALLAAIGAAGAQEANSGSQSGSTSGANSGSVSGVQSSNSGNTTAIGNQNASRSESGSTSGASSGSLSGAMGNNVTLNQNVPSVQNINQSGTSTSTNTNMMGGGTNNTDNVKYSGTIENRASGGYTNTTNENVHYSGTQTIKNVPGIAMSGPASGPCTGASGGLGIAGPGFGVGLNGAKVDDGCTVRENTRILGQMMQSLDSADPLKAQAKNALSKSMMILEAMNDKIGSGYVAQPAPEPKRAEVAPATTVTQVQPNTPIMMPDTTVAAVSEPSDPYVRARMGLPKR